MAASEAAVTAVMETLGCGRKEWDGIVLRDRPCRVHRKRWRDRGCPVAVAAADAAVDADRASIQAETLREAAEGIRHAELTCTVGRTCHLADALTLEARAGGIEPQP